MQNPKATPLALLALLLFALPLLFTLQKLLELLPLGERSHHQFAGQDNSIMTGPIYRLGQILKSFLIRFLYAGN